MKSFEHINVKSVHEAIEALRMYNGKGKLMAGGTDLLGILKDDIFPEYPKAIINMKTIPGLNIIHEDENGLSIGPLARLSDIIKSPLIREKYSMLSESAATVASAQLRNLGTIGGNLCQDVRCWYYRYPHEIGGRIMCSRKGEGSCAAIAGDNRYHAILGGFRCFAVCPSDMAVALTALKAEIDIAGSNGERSLPVEDLYTPMDNNLKSDEIIIRIRVPRVPGNSSQKFLKFTLRKPIDFAVVSFASVINEVDGICQDATMVLGAVAPRPMRLLASEQLVVGRSIDSKTADEAAETALAKAKALSKNEYKVEIAKSLIKKALLL